MKRSHLVGILLLLVAAGAAVFFVGKQADIPDQVALNIPLEGQLQTLDPAKLSDPATSKVLWAIYEGLVELDRDGKVVPLLAESWNASPDWRRWSFKIRHGVNFHRHPAFGPAGTREATAQDVVYSYQRLASGFGSFVFQGLIEGFGDFVTGKAKDISGIHAVSDDEVVFDLTRSDPSFIHRVTSPYLAIMPHEVIEADQQAFGTTVAVGTGPFLLKSTEPTRITLERNPKYWRITEGNVQTLRFIVQPNPLFRQQNFRSGRFDLIEVPPELAAEFVGPGGTPMEGIDAELVAVNTFNVHYLGFNMEGVKDLSVRKKIQQALDGQVIVRSLLPYSAVAWSSPVPPDMQDYVPPAKSPVDRDAGRVTRQASQGNAFTLLVSSDTPTHSDVAQVLRQQLIQVEIRVDIELVDFNNFVARLFSDDRPALFLGYSEWVYSAPELVMEQFRSTAIPNPNLFRYDNTTVDGVIAQFSETSSRARLNAICARVEEKIQSDPPAVWLFHMVHNFALRREVTNFFVTGDNHWLLEDVRVARH